MLGCERAGIAPTARFGCPEGKGENETQPAQCWAGDTPGMLVLLALPFQQADAGSGGRSRGRLRTRTQAPWLLIEMNELNFIKSFDPIRDAWWLSRLSVQLLISAQVRISGACEM